MSLRLSSDQSRLHSENLSKQESKQANKQTKMPPQETQKSNNKNRISLFVASKNQTSDQRQRYANLGRKNGEGAPSKCSCFDRTDFKYKQVGRD